MREIYFSSRLLSLAVDHGLSLKFDDSRVLVGTCGDVHSDSSAESEAAQELTDGNSDDSSEDESSDQYAGNAEMRLSKIFYDPVYSENELSGLATLVSKSGSKRIVVLNDTTCECAYAAKSLLATNEQKIHDAVVYSVGQVDRAAAKRLDINFVETDSAGKFAATASPQEADMIILADGDLDCVAPWVLKHLKVGGLCVWPWHSRSDFSQESFAQVLSRCVSGLTFTSFGMEIAKLKDRPRPKEDKDGTAEV